jgi:hypothetical protein
MLCRRIIPENFWSASCLVTNPLLLDNVVHNISDHLLSFEKTSNGLENLGIRLLGLAKARGVGDTNINAAAMSMRVFADFLRQGLQPTTHGRDLFAYDCVGKLLSKLGSAKFHLGRNEQTIFLNQSHP